MQWQDVQPDKVYIGIPPFATRLRSTYDLPPQLLEDPLVEIVHLPVDFGPLSKIMGAIYGEKDPDTCIMTVDDDAEPNSEQLRRFLTWASVLPGLAVGGGGWNSTCIVGTMPLVCPANLQQYLFVQPSLDHMCQPSSIDMYGIKECFTPVSNEPRGVQVLQGVRGILYRRGEQLRAGACGGSAMDASLHPTPPSVLHGAFSPPPLQACLTMTSSTCLSTPPSSGCWKWSRRRSRSWA